MKKRKIEITFVLLACAVQTVAFYILWQDDNNENDDPSSSRNCWRLYLNRLFILATGFLMLRHEMTILYDVFIIRITTATVTNEKAEEKKDTNNTVENAQQVQILDLFVLHTQKQEDPLVTHQYDLEHRPNKDDEGSSNGSWKMRIMQQQHQVEEQKQEQSTKNEMFDAPWRTTKECYYHKIQKCGVRRYLRNLAFLASQKVTRWSFKVDALTLTRNSTINVTWPDSSRENSALLG